MARGFLFGGLRMALRLFLFDGAELAAVSPEGVAMRWEPSEGWLSPEGSVELGRMVLSDERAVELEEAKGGALGEELEREF